VEILGFNLDLWSLLGLAGSAGLGFFGKLLGGWWGYLAAFVAGAGLAVFLVLKIVGWQDAAEERDRLRWLVEGQRIEAAATEAQHQVELVDRDRALAASEAAAAADRARQDDLQAQLDLLRGAPAEDDKPLSPTGQRFFEGLRAGGE
jgi:hypothetical protein